MGDVSTPTDSSSDRAEERRRSSSTEAESARLRETRDWLSPTSTSIRRARTAAMQACQPDRSSDAPLMASSRNTRLADTSPPRRATEARGDLELWKRSVDRFVDDALDEVESLRAFGLGSGDVRAVEHELAMTSGFDGAASAALDGGATESIACHT